MVQPHPHYVTGEDPEALRSSLAASSGADPPRIFVLRHSRGRNPPVSDQSSTFGELRKGFKRFFMDVAHSFHPPFTPPLLWLTPLDLPPSPGFRPQLGPSLTRQSSDGTDRRFDVSSSSSYQDCVIMVPLSSGYIVPPSTTVLGFFVFFPIPHF